MPTFSILPGDTLERLHDVPPGSCRCCVTSPPYWGLRDYGCDGQIGLEETPEQYVSRLVDVFRLVRDALAEDGTLWLNLGDSYAANRTYQVPDSKWCDVGNSRASTVPSGLKPKDLVGIPWRVAFALQADGWWLRSDIIWSKPNPMPESVTDRPTKAHEYVFMLSKSSRYFFDQEAVREESLEDSGFAKQRAKGVDTWQYGRTAGGNTNNGVGGTSGTRGFRNLRSVWTIATSPCPEAHFATMPPELAERCIKAGSAPGDTVLDPFAGSGTTLGQAVRLGRRAVGVELNPAYIEIAHRRIARMLGHEPEQEMLFGGAS